MRVEDVLAALADGTATSVELVAEALARVAAEDGRVRAVLALAPDALAQAHRSDERRALGRPLSRWDGVPVLVKDCIETADMPTTFGSRLFEGWRPRADAGAVARLRDAGVVVLGKASLDDFAAACDGVSSLGGTMHNPHDLDRSVGGSSGGSAAAVAAGYVAMALGTDTGGSLRIPAALCGVATLRPSLGAVPVDGCFPRSPSQDVVGPLASDVDGLVEAMMLLADRTTLREEVDARRGAPWRVGVAETGFALFGDEPEGPGVQALRRVVAALSAVGVEMVTVPAPERELLGAGSAITGESPDAVAKFLRQRPWAPVRDLGGIVAAAGVSDAARATFERELASGVAPERAGAVERARAGLEAWWRGVCADVDVLLIPAVQTVATRAGEAQTGVFTRLSEHTGSPAAVVPVRLPGIDLPLGIEVVGPPGGDAVVLAAASLVESASLRRP